MTKKLEETELATSQQEYSEGYLPSIQEACEGIGALFQFYNRQEPTESRAENSSYTELCVPYMRKDHLPLEVA